MSLAQIQEAIEELSAEEMRTLRAWLSDRTDEAADDQADDVEGVRIAQKRLDELSSGKVKGLSHEEFWAEMNARRDARAAARA